MNCGLNLPYPPIEVERKNTCSAGILLNDYAGKHGEMTAITQYLYQHFITGVQFKELSKDLECIAASEMKHMEMLGELIVLLGGDPLLRTLNSGGAVYWNGNNIKPTKNIRCFLNENIAGEETAIQNYRQHIVQIKDRYVRAVLERIILDEEHHISIFKQWLEKLYAK